MRNSMLEESLNIVYTYLSHKYATEDLERLCCALNVIVGEKQSYKEIDTISNITYENVQEYLSNINEKEDGRKIRGVYYTPYDVVKFMLYNSVKASCKRLKSTNLHVLDLDGVPYKTVCYNKTIFDPTCGAGVFLLASLDMKFDLLDANVKNVRAEMISKIVSTIYGNDTNLESTAISKIRLYLCALHRYGIKRVAGIEFLLNESFYNYDFVQNPVFTKKYDIIIGNPPYVEDAKSGLNHKNRYGNIYANVLKNSADILSENGVFSFIIPLSYVSTPRMKSIREDLFNIVPEQYILNYSDRPDCLFTSVHQKLCILISIKKNSPRTIYTSNYKYWYKDERKDLFTSTEVIKNNLSQLKFIPKLGTELDKSIYQKIINNENHDSIDSISVEGTGKVYLNMRAAFWIKAFINPHDGSDYKTLHFQNQNIANYVSCLLNSSLFWWYWNCVSDCWHITKKELSGFKVPLINDYNQSNNLANQLEKKLEKTKLYVGTSQIDYEYKHKDCVDKIHQIDDFVNELYNLSDTESLYIKNYAYRYRVSGGAECNGN